MYKSFTSKIKNKIATVSCHFENGKLILNKVAMPIQFALILAVYLQNKGIQIGFTETIVLASTIFLGCIFAGFVWDKAGIFKLECDWRNQRNDIAEIKKMIKK